MRLCFYVFAITHSPPWFPFHGGRKLTEIIKNSSREIKNSNPSVWGIMYIFVHTLQVIIYRMSMWEVVCREVENNMGDRVHIPSQNYNWCSLFMAFLLPLFDKYREIREKWVEQGMTYNKGQKQIETVSIYYNLTVFIVLVNKTSTVLTKLLSK